MKNEKTWFVLADGARARIITLDTNLPSNQVNVVEEFVSPAPPSREIMTDRPGRSHDRMGEHRHANEPPTDAHRHEKAEFARSVADYLDKALNEQRYQEIVLVAAPRTLGDLRSVLSGQVQGHVVSQVDKDLTGLPTAELATRLNELAS